MPSRSGLKSYRVSFDFYVTSGVKLLLIANFSVYIAQLFIYHFGREAATSRFQLLFGLVPAGVVPGLRLWQPFTYLFLHDVNSVWHILTNMFMLWMFGRELELVWGKNRFLRYYFLTGVGAGVINVIVKTIPTVWGHAPSDIPTIGASGAIFGVMIACAVLFPDRRAYLFPIPVSMSMRTIVLIMIVVTFLGTLGVGGDGVSHLCHLGGMLVGYLYLRRDSYLFRLRNNVSDWQYQRNRKKFEVFMNKRKDEPPSRPDNLIN